METRSLLVLSRFGVFRRPLASDGRWIVGRGEDCDVRIDDAKASRHHCALVLGDGDGDGIEVVDLGSTNGTLLSERRLAPERATRLRAGEPITIGGTVLMVQRDAAAPCAILSGEAFAHRVESERIEAARGGRAFAVAHVRFHGGGAPSEATRTRSATAEALDAAAAIEGALADLARPGDAITYAGSGEYRLLLVGATADVAEHHAARLRASLAARSLHASVGVGASPRDGRSLAELVAAAVTSSRAGAAARATPPPRAGGALDRLAPLIERVAAGTINVLVLGETGVGKELLARTIHARSPRAAAPMVSINCAALAESMLESELFGHERGAFTGATQTKPGLLESADGGTVFLDEVGEMPASLQAKLLRVLEQREVLRVGARRALPIDVRFVAATNRDLAAEVTAGRFRADLYFRLDGVTLTLPPLRDRVDEIEPLARAFAARAAAAAAAAATPARAAPAFTPEAIAALRRHAWPGNIRELRNVVERAVLLAGDDVVGLAHLPAFHAARPIAHLPRRLPARAPDERSRIEDALSRSGGNQSKAAELLGVSRRTLISRLVEYAIPRPRDAR